MESISDLLYGILTQLNLHRQFGNPITYLIHRHNRHTKVFLLKQYN
jgi:hypothetical protein